VVAIETQMLWPPELTRELHLAKLLCFEALDALEQQKMNPSSLNALIDRVPRFHRSK